MFLFVVQFIIIIIISSSITIILRSYYNIHNSFPLQTRYSLVIMFDLLLNWSLICYICLFC